MITIYLSSTLHEMQACHTTVAHALQQMHYNVVTTEDFIAIAQEHPSSQDRSSSQGGDRAPLGGFISPIPTTNSGELHQTQDRDLTSTLDQCLAAIVNCDLYLGLFAQHHVSTPQANNPPSLAELLYRKAVQLNKPRLIFLPAQDASWSPTHAGALFISPPPLAGDQLDDDPPDRVAPPLAGDHPKHSLHYELTHEHNNDTYFFKSPEHLLSLLGPAILSWQEAQQGTRGSIQQRIEQLIYWWQYTLLRCSLTSQADRYPTEAFTLLLQQQREPEVLQLVDSLSDPVRKVAVLLQIARDLADRVAPPLAGDPSNSDEKRHQLLTKAHVIARSIKVGKPRSEALLAVCTEFARTHQWERAEAVLRILNDGKATVQAYGRLWIELVRAQQPERARQIWARLEAASQGIELSETRAEALYELSGELIQAQQWQRANDTWGEAETFAQAIEDAETREQMLLKLDAAACSFVVELSRARQWTHAEAIVKKLQRSETRARALCLLAIESATLGRRERAQSLLTRAVKVAHTIEPDTRRAEVAGELAALLTLADQSTQATSMWTLAETTAQAMQDPWQKAGTLWQLGVSLLQAQRTEQHRAEALWAQAASLKQTQRPFEPGLDNADALRKLVVVLLQAQQWQRAREIAFSIQPARLKDDALCELGIALAQSQQWSQAEEIARAIANVRMRAEVLSTLGTALARSQQWQRATTYWVEADDLRRTLNESYARSTALRELANVLAQTQQPEQARTIWAEAERIARLIEEHDIRADALRELGIALAQAHDIAWANTIWIEAERVACQVRPEWYRARLLRMLSVALAQVQQWQRAEEVALQIDEIWASRAEALRELALRLVQQREWRRAADVAYMIKERRIRADVLQELSAVFIAAQEWTLAEAVVRMVEDREARVRILCELAIAQVQASRSDHPSGLSPSQQDPRSDHPLRSTASERFGAGLAERAEERWIEAQTLARTLDTARARCEALREIGSALAQVQYQERADAIWTEAAAIARHLEPEWARAEALRKLGSTLAQAHDLEFAVAILAEAETSARSIGQDRNRAEALSDLGATLAEAQQWARAEAIWAEAITVARTMDEEPVRALILRQLAVMLAQAGRWERARTTALLIAEVWASRDAALRDIATLLMQARKWEQAEAIVDIIKENRIKIEALRDLGTELTRAQQEWRIHAVWTQAETIVRKIEPAPLRVDALRKLGAALAQARQATRATRAWKEAEDIAHTIEDPDERADTLNKIAQALQSSGDHEQLCSLIQRAWSQATTRTDAIKLLPLVNLLIPLKPETGPAFFDAFAWVDHLLTQSV